MRQLEGPSPLGDTDTSRADPEAMRARIAELEREVAALRSGRRSETPGSVFPSPDAQRRLGEVVHHRTQHYLGLLLSEVARSSGDLLTVTLSYTELALGELDPESPVREWISEIRDCAMRNETLTKRLVSATRRKAAPRELMTPKVLLRRCEARLRERLSAGQTLTVEVQTSRLIDVDPELVTLALESLIDNSVEAMAGPGRVRVLVTDATRSSTDSTNRTSSGPHVRIRVEDSGPGIPVEHRERVFDPFFSTRRDPRHPGLGLPTCELVARVHGGTIEIAECQSGGAVEMVLPCAGGEPTSQSEATPADGTRAPTVLLVEDEFTIRQLGRRILADAGYQVLVASSAAEALDLARRREEAVDLVVTDVVMPKMSGPELARVLRSEFPRLGVLYVSGFTRDDLDDMRGLEGSVDLLPKPFHPDELLARVQAAIERARRMADTIPPARP